VTSLTPCRHCGAAISPSAPRCPHCGVEQPGQQAAARALHNLTKPGTLAAFAVLYLLVRCAGPPPPKPPPPSPAERLAACGTDMPCVADALTARAAAPCRAKIEALAQYDARWQAGGPAFTAAQWLDEEHTLIALAGDGLEMQNGFGGWFHHRYSCMYNLTTGRADFATVKGGP